MATATSKTSVLVTSKTSVLVTSKTSVLVTSKTSALHLKFLGWRFQHQFE
jgi:hypothetical protein